MRLSKASYFADFVVYPPIVVTLMIAALWREPPRSWIEASFACLAGIAVWTFLEYVIHRVVLHEVRFWPRCTTCIMISLRVSSARQHG